MRDVFSRDDLRGDAKSKPHSISHSCFHLTSPQHAKSAHGISLSDSAMKNLAKSVKTVNEEGETTQDRSSSDVGLSLSGVPGNLN